MPDPEDTTPEPDVAEPEDTAPEPEPEDVAAATTEAAETMAHDTIPADNGPAATDDHHDEAWRDVTAWDNATAPDPLPDPSTFEGKMRLALSGLAGDDAVDQACEGVLRLLELELGALSPAARPDPESDLGRAVALDELNGQLCVAVGLDPERVEGFRLTVTGGSLPVLEAWHARPTDERGDLTDGWVLPLARRFADTTQAILPGSAATVPPARDPGDIVGPGWVVDSEHLVDAAAARVLPMLAEAVNGAPLDLDTRDRVTSTAWAAGQALAERVRRVRRPQRKERPAGENDDA